MGAIPVPCRATLLVECGRRNRFARFFARLTWPIPMKHSTNAWIPSPSHTRARRKMSASPEYAIMPTRNARDRSVEEDSRDS
jgi:hypothetical protein